MMRVAAAFAAAALAAAAPAAAQSGTTTLDLRVVEEGSGQPLANAVVRIAGVRAQGWTDQAGRTRIAQIPVGTRLVSVTRAGFSAQRMTIGFGGEGVEGEVELSPLPIRLAPVNVVARQQHQALRNRGFYDRLRQGHATVITAEDIERQRPHRTIEIFHQVRGIQVNLTQDGRQRLSTSRGGERFGDSPCVPQVYLDGVLVGLDPARVDPGDVVQPHHIEAIEVFAGPATIPVELNITGSVCGVIVIWTKTGG